MRAFYVDVKPREKGSARMQQDVLLVGSIPLDTSEAVFRDFGKPLGSALKAMPDGEVGPRKHWISRIHYQVLAGHPELETVRYPAPENGVERRNPRNAGDSYLFKVKDGVETRNTSSPTQASIHPARSKTSARTVPDHDRADALALFPRLALLKRTALD
jgi:hypothetical protein